MRTRTNATLPRWSLSAAFLILTTAGVAAEDRIRVSRQYPAYWEYKGEPVLLLGGSPTDRIHMSSDVDQHLNALRWAGGNYVRVTLSGQNRGSWWPARRPEKLYDLLRLHEMPWGKIAEFLDLTAERDIIVQVEIWASFDYYGERWAANPFNPKNNRNYTADESGLPTSIEGPPPEADNPFFRTVPAEHNNTLVLKYQQRFVDKVLSHTLRYGHVLYCMDNEPTVTAEWGKYWSEYVRARAEEAGVHVDTAEAWNPPDVTAEDHDASLKPAETYSFVDISLNNLSEGQAHWDRILMLKEALGAQVRPINNARIHGNDKGRVGSSREGKERFWRNVFAGCASARFHRRHGGLGLAQPNIRSLRMLTGRLGIFSCTPRNDLLEEREPNEAYCIADPGRAYAVYFPAGGRVRLDTSALAGPLAVTWLEIPASRWSYVDREAAAGSWLELSAPTEEPWAALIAKAE